MAKQKLNQIIAVHAPVEITAADGEGKSQPKFDVTAYNGGALEVGGWDRPVVIDLAGMDFHKSVIANLGHDSDQFVGHVTAKDKTESTIQLSGVFSAETAARDTIVKSAANGFPFEASVEVTPKHKGVDSIDAGKTVKVNGQEFPGPIYVARKSTLTGFGFVLRGADPETVVSIAAKAASNKEQDMKAEVKAWVAEMLPSVDIDSLTADEVKNLEATFAGQNGEKPKPIKAGSPFEVRKLEAKRREELQQISDRMIERSNGRMSEEEITAVENMQEHAIKTGMSPVEYRVELQEAMLPTGVTIRAPQSQADLSGKVMEAAICQAGGLPEKDRTGKLHFDDQTMQAAHDRFKHGIGLKQLLILAAEANGLKTNGYNVDIEVQRAAMGMVAPNRIKAQGWSTFSLPVTLANVANKFIRDGWDFVEQEWRKISVVSSVSDFKEITTVSLFDGLMYESLSPNGEIKHGTVGETTYGNKADTYARMFAVDRRDIINDNLGALTKVPRKLGRGGALKLNDIFWTEFLNPTTSNFWHSNHANVNTGVADMTIAGLTATELIFMALLGPDGNILGSMPKILLVPPALKAAALTLMSSERLIDGTATAVQGSTNIWKGRFDVVCSQYLGSTAYTGYDLDAYYLLADPNDIPGIEVVALNGKVEPTVDTADADFNVLGIQMRGYCDVGVRVQEPLCGVRADGGSS